MPFRYMPKQGRSSYDWYVSFYLLMDNNAVMLSLLESLKESQVNRKELELLYLDNIQLKASRYSSVILLTEAAEFYIKNYTKSDAFTLLTSISSASSCYKSCTSFTTSSPIC